MTPVSTTTHPSDTAAADSEIVRDAVDLLRRTVTGDVETDARRRAEYSTDASNYRVVPQVVVFPRSTDDLLAANAAARSTGLPLTLRGGGTSVAGNSIGPGIVVDCSRHLDAIDNLDPEARTAVVQPGVVLGALQQRARPHGLRFGPDPSTWSRCTLGGMIGNNACGSHSLAYGRTADNVLELDVIDGTGRRFTAGTGLDVVPGLEAFSSANLATLRTEFGTFGRQVSGYSLEHLLPERGRNLARALVGTEGSCVTVLGATVSLVPLPKHTVLAVLGFADMIAAAGAVPEILRFGPGSVEGLDARLVDAVGRFRGADARADLPAGGGWLLVEFAGDEAGDLLDRARRVAAAAAAVDHRVVTSAADAARLAAIRQDGAGLAGRTQDNKQAWPGFEDAAVPPERLGDYLRDFDALLDRHRIVGMPYGHFGDGCIHVRLDIPLDKPSNALREFMSEAADLVAGYGGSISGEHGDGRARSELLPRMYSERAIAALAGFKQLFDPQDVLNPGVVVRPAPLDADLRRPQALPMPAVGGFAFAHDDGDFTTAVHRCVGVGKCRADNTASGGFMCPSYQATADEKDSTRGRARVLQEMINGGTVAGGWKAPEVADSLDLCLSCKACASDCPAGVDMAALKSETLYRRYRRKLRPVTHYALGWLPRWARLASPFARVVNAVLRVRAIERAVLRLGGMDTRRRVPAFATRPLRNRDLRTAAPDIGQGTGRSVVLWADSFSRYFTPAAAGDAVAVLAAAGFDVVAPDKAVCCGLTWISTGQLPAARKRLRQLVDTLYPEVEQGRPIVGIEPSCTAVLRSDLLELLPDDPRAAAVAANTVTLAELLAGKASVQPDPQWQPPRLDGVELVVQPHCHHHAVMGFEADRALLKGLGATVTEVSGCCGLAGNFGMERGHYDVSVAVAEHSLLPAVQAAPDAIVLADGFSCRTQLDQLADRPAIHLAELLAGRLPRSRERAS